MSVAEQLTQLRAAALALAEGLRGISPEAAALLVDADEGVDVDELLAFADDVAEAARIAGRD